MNSRVAVDTNVLIYLFDEASSGKRNVAERLISDTPCVPSQVISEFINVSKRLLPLAKVDLMKKCAQLMQYCTIIPVNQSILEQSVRLIEKYDFQIFDSIILSAALAADCHILYSEDMQHGLLVNDQLKIINPFANN